MPTTPAAWGLAAPRPEDCFTTTSFLTQKAEEKPPQDIVSTDLVFFLGIAKQLGKGSGCPEGAYAASSQHTRPGATLPTCRGSDSLTSPDGTPGRPPRETNTQLNSPRKAFFFFFSSGSLAGARKFLAIFARGLQTKPELLAPTRFTEIPT